MNIEEIRKRFVAYYQDMGYELLPSAPMIDPSIPMSFVMSAGLVQVENSLATKAQRNGDHYVLVQNCFRHFDLDKVGKDNVHLSFFEMPGAFIFGPNGKSKAIQKMWQLVTSVLEIEKNNIWATYFSGGTVMGIGLPEDSETKHTWLETGIEPNQLIGLGPENNYWVQGRSVDELEIRKCGPNTELFYDRGNELRCSVNCKPGCACGRFIEFSNSLFIHFEAHSKSTFLNSLSNPFTETVIGIERVAMITQNIPSVFDICEIKRIKDELNNLIEPGHLESQLDLSSKNIIADHLRSFYYLIANEAPSPGKDGRARIVRVLIRRLITRLFILGIHPVNNRSTFTNLIKDTVPDDLRHDWVMERIELYFDIEAKRFLQTIRRAIKQLDRYITLNGKNSLSTEQVEYLERCMGMPSLLVNQLLINRTPLTKAIRSNNSAIRVKEISSVV